MDRLEVGTVVDDKYVLESVIGEGGMGRVFAARDLELNRIVAIKFLHSDTLDAEQGQSRFMREAKILSKLSHPNIVTFYRFGLHEKGHRYIAMEHVQGKNIRQFLDEHETFPLEQFFSVSSQLCEALNAAHRLNIVHRDLKPVNVLLTSDFSVKVIDFGLSKFVESEGPNADKMTQTGLLVGTAHYMSPEQCVGIKPDNRSDIYAAGCILFEMLTGRPPFDADSPVSVIYKQANEAPPLISERRNQVPVGLENIIEKCLAKAPSDRYQNVAELQRDLAVVAEGRGDQIPTYRNFRKKRNPALLLIAVITILMAGSAAVVIYNRTSRSVPQRQALRITTHRRTTIEGQLQEALRLRQSAVGPQRHERLKQSLDMLNEIVDKLKLLPPPNSNAFQAYLLRGQTREEMAYGKRRKAILDEAAADARKAISYATYSDGRIERDAAVAMRALGDALEQRAGKPNADSIDALRSALKLYNSTDGPGQNWQLIKEIPGRVGGIDWDLQLLEKIELYAYWTEHDDKAIQRLEKLLTDWIARNQGPTGSAIEVAVDLTTIYNDKHDIQARDKLLARATKIIYENTNNTSRQRVDCHVRLAALNAACDRPDAALREIRIARDLGALLDTGFSWRAYNVLKQVELINRVEKNDSEIASLKQKFLKTYTAAPTTFSQ